MENFSLAMMATRGPSMESMLMSMFTQKMLCHEYLMQVPQIGSAINDNTELLKKNLYIEYL